MLRGRCSCAISERPAPSSTQQNPLSPTIPALTGHSPVTPIIPALTQNPPGGGVKNQLSPFNRYFKIIYPARKCRRADIASADHENTRILFTQSCEGPALWVLFRGPELQLRHKCSETIWASAPEESARSRNLFAANPCVYCYFIYQCRSADIPLRYTFSSHPGTVGRPFPVNALEKQ